MLQDAVKISASHTTRRIFATREMQLPRGDPSTARLHREWLKKLPSITGKTLTRIAKEIRIAPSTLTRPLQEGDDGISTLHANTIGKVVEHTKVPAPGELGAPPRGRRTRLLGEEVTPFKPDPNDPVEAVIAALVGQGRAVTSWRLVSRAVELAGYLPGDVLLLDTDARPAPGDLVCAQVRDWPAMVPETVVRIFERAPPVDLLVAHSYEHHQPLVVDGERIVVQGVFLPHRLRPAA